jgi:hypothetical protein
MTSFFPYYDVISSFPYWALYFFRGYLSFQMSFPFFPHDTLSIFPYESLSIFPYESLSFFPYEVLSFFPYEVLSFFPPPGAIFLSQLSFCTRRYPPYPCFLPFFLHPFFSHLYLMRCLLPICMLLSTS